MKRHYFISDKLKQELERSGVATPSLCYADTGMATPRWIVMGQ